MNTVFTLIVEDVKLEYVKQVIWCNCQLVIWITMRHLLLLLTLRDTSNTDKRKYAAKSMLIKFYPFPVSANSRSRQNLRSKKKFSSWVPASENFKIVKILVLAGSGVIFRDLGGKFACSLIIINTLPDWNESLLYFV